MERDEGVIINIDEEGGISALYDEKDVVDAIFEPFNGEIRRASHVRPHNILLKIPFIILRGIFSDGGRVAAWTRKWNCRWIANMEPMDGPVLGPYTTRQEAINAEKDWLWENKGL